MRAGKPDGEVDEASLRARLLSGAKWTISLRLVAQAFSWLVTLVMVRLLTPHDYGLNAMLEAPVEILLLVGTLGVDSALIRFRVKDPQQLASAFGFLLLTNAALAAVLFFGAPWVAAYFNAPPLTPLIRAAALVFLLVPFRTIPNALLDMNLDFKLRAEVDLKATVLASLIGLALAFAGAGVWALVAVTLLTASLKAVMLAWYRPWFVVPRLDPAVVRPLLGYGVTLASGTLLTMLAGRSFSVIGGPQIGAEALGLYAVASTFAYLPITKAMPIIQQTLFPAYASLASDPSLVRKYALNALELSFITIVPIGIGMAATSSSLVDAVFGPRWSAVALPLAVLCALTPLRLLNRMFEAPLNATGHARVVTAIATLSLLTLAGGVLLAVRWGIMGLVVLSSMNALVVAVVALVASCRLFDIPARELLQVVARPLVASAVMAAAVVGLSLLLADFSPVLSLALEASVGALAYLGALQLLMGARLRHILGVLRARPKR
jgi:O-antigen/teichoic acid export membrane protein